MSPQLYCLECRRLLAVGGAFSRYPDRRPPVTSHLSTFATVAGAFLLAPSLVVAQAQITTPRNDLPPGLGSAGVPIGSSPEGRLDPGPAAAKPVFKELRLDAQTGALNSFVRIGPATNGQGQGSAESRSSGSSTTGPNDRRAPELFKLGGNIKF